MIIINIIIYRDFYFMGIIKAIIIAIILSVQELFTHIFEYSILFFTSFLLVLKTVGIAIFGGFTDYMIQRKKSNENFSFKKSFFHCFIAGFTGFLAQKLCNGFQINADLTAFLIGISGFAGTRMLLFFEKLSKSIFEKVSNLEIDVKFGKSNEKDDDKDKRDENI